MIWRSRCLRCATYSSSTAAGSSITSPWPGQIRATRLILRSRSSDARYCDHVAAALRVDDRGGAVEHVVAGEQRALLVEQEAEVVRRVAGRVHRLEPELGAVDRVAVAEHEVELEVTSSAFGNLPNAPTTRAGLLADPVGRGPVIGMRVREQDPLHTVAHRGADDRLDVLRDVGTGIDHRDLVDADEIGVGARARSSGSGLFATTRRINGESALGTSGVMAAHDYSLTSPASGALGAERDVGQRDGPAAPSAGRRRRAARRARRFRRRYDAGRPLASRGDRVEIGEEIGGAFVTRERAQAHLGREDQVDLARGVLRERVDRADPRRRDELVVVVRAVFAVGRGRDEEPRVVAPRRAERREPVREQPQLARVEHEVARLEQIDERERRRRSDASRASASVGVVLDRHARRRVGGQQDAGLLEALAQRRDPERRGRRAARPCSALAARSSRPTTRARMRVSASAASTAPPGNTVAPGPNTARPVRSSINTWRSGRSETRMHGGGVADRRALGRGCRPSATRTERTPPRRRLSSIQSTWPLRCPDRAADLPNGRRLTRSTGRRRGTALGVRPR